MMAAMRPSRSINVIYLSRFIDAFSAWATGMAAMIWLSRTYGASQVSGALFIGLLPGLILANIFSSRLKRYNPRNIIIVGQIFYFSGIAILAITPSIEIFYLSVILSGISAMLTTPYRRELIKQFVSGEEIAIVHTRLSALQYCTLVFAPISGGALIGIVGFQAVFFLGASLSLCSALLLLVLPVNGYIQPRSSTISSMADGWISTFATSPSVRRYAIYYLFIAFFSGTEYYFYGLKDLDPSGISFAMAAWGGGTVVAYIVAPRIKINIPMRLIFSAPVLIGAIVVFSLSSSLVSTLASFLVGGVANTLTSGGLNAAIHREFATKQSSGVWINVNIIANLIALLSYGLCFISIRDDGGLTARALLYATSSVLFVSVVFYLILDLRASAKAPLVSGSAD